MTRSPSPERAALAEVIEARNAARARLDGLRLAERRSGAGVWQAEEAARAAKCVVGQAAVDDARARTDALLSDTPAPAATLQAARAALVEAEDAVQAAIVARDTIRSDLAELERAAPMRDVAVGKGAVAVARAEGMAAIQTLIADIEVLHRQVSDKGLALVRLVALDIVQESGPAALPGVMESQVRFQSSPEMWIISNRPDASPLRDAWAQAFAALKDDAGAPIPPVK